jgi:hypothetical protein
MVSVSRNEVLAVMVGISGLISAAVGKDEWFVAKLGS